MTKLAKPATAALAILVVIALAAITAPLFEAILGTAHDVPDLAQRHCAASLAHPLGCDDVGQDLFLRLLFGARVSLAVGLGATLVSTIVGCAVGLTAGMLGGAVDAIAMRFVDTLLAIPLLPLLLLGSAMSIGAAGASTLKLIVLLGLFGFMGVARIARAEALRIARLDYAIAARALGANAARILVRHVLPNAIAPVVVAAALDVGRNILAEAALSFLGLGIEPPVPSWGNMLRHAEDAIQSDPALAFWPGSCILLTVASVYVLGEGLRSALDPRGPRS
jgi:peptide/nickel transport system permease protein